MFEYGAFTVKQYFFTVITANNTQIFEYGLIKLI